MEESRVTSADQALRELRRVVVCMLLDSNCKGGKLDKLTGDVLVTALLGDVLVIREKRFAMHYKKYVFVGMASCVIARCEEAIHHIQSGFDRPNGQLAEIAMRKKSKELAFAFRSLGLETLLNAYLEESDDLPRGTRIDVHSGAERMCGLIGATHELFGLGVALRLTARLLKLTGHTQLSEGLRRARERRGKNGIRNGKKAPRAPFMGGGTIAFPSPDALDHFLVERQFKGLVLPRLRSREEDGRAVVEAYLGNTFIAEGCGNSLDEARRALLARLVESPELEH